MIGLGIVLAGGALAFTALLIVYNLAGGPTYTPQIFGMGLPSVNTLEVFCAGFALALIAWFGMRLVRMGGTRQRRLRSRVRELESERTEEHAHI